MRIFFPKTAARPVLPPPPHYLHTSIAIASRPSRRIVLFEFAVECVHGASTLVLLLSYFSFFWHSLRWCFLSLQHPLSPPLSFFDVQVYPYSSAVAPETSQYDDAVPPAGETLGCKALPRATSRRAPTGGTRRATRLVLLRRAIQIPIRSISFFNTS